MKDLIFLLLAVFLHFLFLFIFDFRLMKYKEPDSPIAIDLYDKPVVITSRSYEEDSDSKARFYSEFKNRVKKETMAKKSGRFKDGEDLGLFGESDKNFFSDSMTPNYIEGIVEGSRTLLNTDPIYYASFINRIADEIYESWVKYAERALREVFSSGRRLKPEVYVTKLSVLMDRDGNVLSVGVLKSSGVFELDESTKMAFWDNEPFPNPPLPMFGRKDVVKLYYDFYFELRNSGFLIVPFL